MELRQRLITVVELIASTKPVAADTINAEVRHHGIDTWGDQRRTKEMIRLGKHYREHGQLGRVRAVLLVGIAQFGNAFLSKIERTGILLSDGGRPKKFSQFLSDFFTELQRNPRPEWAFLSDRLRNYLTFERVTSDLTVHDEPARRVLAAPSRHAVKQVMALVQLAFLRRYFGHDLSEEIAALLDGFGTPEELAAIASAIIAVANEIRPLDSRDFADPAIASLFDSEVLLLLRFGRAVVARHTLAKEVSLFGYSVEERPALGKVYVITAPTRAFEYTLRLGFVRVEIGKDGWLAPSRENPVPDLSLATIAEALVSEQRERIVELRDRATPYRRVRSKFPIVPEMYQSLAKSGFYEDASLRDHLLQDFLVPLRAEQDTPVRLTERLSLEEFWAIWRILQFLSHVDIAAVRPYAQIDRTAFLNSLVRVGKDETLLDVITAVGVDTAQAEDFLRLVSGDVFRLGHYDIQYRPLLRIAQVDVPAKNYTTPPELISLPAVVATANILRNVQSANKVRLAELPGLFVDSVSALMRSRFADVASNRRVTSPCGATDVDVVVLAEDTLFLFECKHSVFPTEPHEVRDIWEDIETGVRQLQVATAALSTPGQLRDYLAGWFPGWKARKLSIQRCILCSHRIFSGLEVEGIPIRDYSSLFRLVDTGVVGIGAVDEDGGTLLHRFRLVDEGGFSASDLKNYLSPEATFFQTFAPFMHPVSKIQRFDRCTLAAETYIYQVVLDEWLDHLQAIGCTQLPDEQRILKKPMSLEVMLRETSGSKSEGHVE